MSKRTSRAVVGYNVYRAEDGVCPEFYGFAKTVEEAKELASGASLEKSLWDTARAAGHCGGISAPEGDEADEPCEWFGDDGYDCLVEVYASPMVDTTATREEIRFSADGSISMVYCDGEPVRCPTQQDLDELPVGSDLTADEIESLAE